MVYTRKQIDNMSNSVLLREFIRMLETWSGQLNAGRNFEPYEKRARELAVEIVKRELITQEDMEIILA